MSTKDSDRTDGINGFAGTGPAKKEKETTDGVKDTDKGSNRVTEAPVVRPSTFALPLLPTTPLQREIETTGHVRATILHKNKDDTIDNPPRLFDDEHGGGGENCGFNLHECNADAKYWISSRDADSPDGIHKTFFCPRHFALRLHNIINEVTHNKWFAEQKTVSQRRAAFQTYFIDWGEI